MEERWGWGRGREREGRRRERGHVEAMVLGSGRWRHMQQTGSVGFLVPGRAAGHAGHVPHLHHIDHKLHRCAHYLAGGENRS